METGGRHGDGGTAPAPDWSERRKRRPLPRTHNAPRQQLTPPPISQNALGPPPLVSHNALRHQQTLPTTSQNALGSPPLVSHNALRYQLTPPPTSQNTLGSPPLVSHNALRHQLTPPPTSQNPSGSRESGEAVRPATTQDAVRHGQEVLSPPRGFGSTDSNVAAQMDCDVDPLSLKSWGLPAGVVAAYAAQQVRSLYAWQARCLTQPGVLQGGNLVFTGGWVSGWVGG
ncbi:uncharacterized protein LOC144954888 [Lampetra fluviatilis]